MLSADPEAAPRGQSQAGPTLSRWLRRSPGGRHLGRDTLVDPPSEVPELLAHAG
jgi:hypothetical protein